MSKQTFSSRIEIPKYSVVILAGHEQSGKSTLAAAYAKSVSPPAKVIDAYATHREYIAKIYGVDEQEFKFPNNRNIAHKTDDDDDISYAEAFDNSYAGLRSALNWDMFINHVQCVILEELSKPDGARCFVVDDVHYADECARLMEYCDGDSSTLYLDGNPSAAKGMDKERFSYLPIEFIGENAGKKIGFHKILTDKQSGETKDAAIARCVKQIRVSLNVSRAQREAKKREEAELKAKKEHEDNSSKEKNES